ncbi:Plasmodium exported protein, unknown function [Plasmodium gonderi]|uniref:Variable surface protein n=1 Tax=Plasmodium gonderi TaxID=77519 RepID=A0A1Y1JTE5_PLAGO|nr:Plasmodium exported protein, unknown function [Plasmodium gonderi]GAW84715.1 Plasmodium exported protein, unknown function [Plasmodium gonderi]
MHNFYDFYLYIDFIDSNRYDPNTSEFIKKLIYNVDIYKLVSITRSSDMQYFDVEEWINQINLKVRIGYNQIKKNSNSEILKKNCCIAINFYMDLIKSAINSSNLINDHKTYSINGLQEYWNEHMNIDVYECKRLNNMFPDLAKCILQKLRDDKYKTENENKTEDYIKTEWEVIFNNAVLCVKSKNMKIINYL